jgi:hypothetical protein
MASAEERRGRSRARQVVSEPSPAKKNAIFYKVWHKNHPQTESIILNSRKYGQKTRRIQFVPHFIKYGAKWMGLRGGIGRKQAILESKGAGTPLKFIFSAPNSNIRHNFGKFDHLFVVRGRKRQIIY